MPVTPRRPTPWPRLCSAGVRALGWSLLVLALLWAPTLGALHRELHVHTGRIGTAAAAGQPVLHSSLSGLFGHHSDSPDCPLFDQCASGDVLVGIPALALPPAPPLYFAVQVLLALPASTPAFYDARGPPRAR